MDFELTGIWDGGPSRQCAENVDASTEDNMIMEVTEQLHPVANSIVLKTETQSAFALDRFLSDTDPWSVFNVPSIQTKALISKPHYGPPSLPGHHVM
jgi:hypothetical protein